MTPNAHRFLLAWSALLTIALGAVLLTGAKEAAPAAFEEIDVQRINIREPDGTLRLIIAGNARAPGAMVRGVEHPHPNAGRRGAGMWFLNDEGTETGGLGFNGRTLDDGSRTGGGRITFDQYEQDQVVQMFHEEVGGRRASGLRVWDRPETPIADLIAEVATIQAMPEPERATAMAALEQANPGPTRLFIGRLQEPKDGSSDALLVLMDGNQKPRLTIRVAADGQAAIEFLDAVGTVTHRLAPESLSDLGRQ